MIKENQKYLNRFHVVLDALVIYCSFCLSYYIRYICPLFKDIFPRFGYWRQLWQYQGILLVLIPVYLILYAKFNLYKPKRFQNQTAEYANLVKANSIGMVFFFIYIIFMKIPHVSRSLQLIVLSPTHSGDIRSMVFSMIISDQIFLIAIPSVLVN